jgi:hypothetical protein
MTAEQRQVLTMLAEHRITVDEAERLYVTLDPMPPAVDPQGSGIRAMLEEVYTGKRTPEEAAEADQSTASTTGAQRLRIQVLSRRGERVNVRLPVSLVSQIGRWIPAGRVTMDGRTITVGQLVDTIRAGHLGTIMEVDTDSGDRVRVTLE